MVCHVVCTRSAHPSLRPGVFRHPASSILVFTLLLASAVLAHGQTCDTSTLSGDMGARVNSCVATLGAAGGTITIPGQSFTVNTQIVLASNITLKGAGSTSTILSAGPSLGANQVIRILGTASASVTNLKVTDLQVQNGTASTSAYTSGMDGIRADYCKNCTFENLDVNSI